MYVCMYILCIGIMPITGGLISLTGSWKRLFGNLVPCMMIDFMIHLIPVCLSVHRFHDSSYSRISMCACVYTHAHPTHTTYTHTHTHTHTHKNTHESLLGV
jgi:hypothetical protein